jgi:hypothetical protein
MVRIGNDGRIIRDREPPLPTRPPFPSPQPQQPQEQAEAKHKTACLVLGIALIIGGIGWAIAAPLEAAVADGSLKGGDKVTFVGTEIISVIRPYRLLTALIGIAPGVVFLVIGKVIRGAVVPIVFAFIGIVLAVNLINYSAASKQTATQKTAQPETKNTTNQKMMITRDDRRMPWRKDLGRYERLALRSEPGGKKLIAQMERGEVVTVLETGYSAQDSDGLPGNWLKVLYGDITGWCFSAYLDPVEEPIHP